MKLTISLFGATHFFLKESELIFLKREDFNFSWKKKKKKNYTQSRILSLQK